MNGIYQQKLLAQARAPVGAGVVPPGTEDAEVFNSACGDEIRVKLRWTPEGALAGMTHETHGCAVCQASASLAVPRLLGKTAAENAGLAAAFYARLGQRGFEDEWGDFQMFNGLEKYPARLACARLVWLAVERALAAKSSSP